MYALTYKHVRCSLTFLSLKRPPFCWGDLSVWQKWRHNDMRGFIWIRVGSWHHIRTKFQSFVVKLSTSRDTNRESDKQRINFAWLMEAQVIIYAAAFASTLIMYNIQQIKMQKALKVDCVLITTWTLQLRLVVGDSTLGTSHLYFVVCILCWAGRGFVDRLNISFEVKCS